MVEDQWKRWNMDLNTHPISFLLQTIFQETIPLLLSATKTITPTAFSNLDKAAPPTSPSDLDIPVAPERSTIDLIV